MQAAVLLFLKGVFVLSNMLRVRFKRGENTKFVSHLDLMRSFERSIRRAGLPLAYSHGFNPHPSMVFGLPLSVGVSSEAEYMDVELTEEMDTDLFLTKINGALPEGLECTEAKQFNEKGNIMKEIAFASYDILANFEGIDDAQILTAVEKLKNAESIIVQKEGKNGIKDMDIKPMLLEVAFVLRGSVEKESVYFKADTGMLNKNGDYVSKYIDAVKRTSWNITYDPDRLYVFSILCSAGSKANMKPELFISAIGKVLEKGINIIKVHRTGLFVEKDGGVLPPV